MNFEDLPEFIERLEVKARTQGVYKVEHEVGLPLLVINLSWQWALSPFFGSGEPSPPH